MSMSKSSNSGPAWRVIKATPDRGQDPTGNYVKGYTVTYVLSNGHPGSVFVPGESIDLDMVRGAVQQQAQSLIDVLGLTSNT